MSDLTVKVGYTYKNRNNLLLNIVSTTAVEIDGKPTPVFMDTYGWGYLSTGEDARNKRNNDLVKEVGPISILKTCQTKSTNISCDNPTLSDISDSVLIIAIMKACDHLDKLYHRTDDLAQITKETCDLFRSEILQKLKG